MSKNNRKRWDEIMTYSNEEMQIIDKIDKCSENIEQHMYNAKVAMFGAVANIAGTGVSMFVVPSNSFTGSVLKALAGTFFIYSGIKSANYAKANKERASRLEGNIESYSIQLQREVENTNVELNYVIDEEIKNRKPCLTPKFAEEIEEDITINRTS